MSPGSIMPRYPWLLTQKLDTSSLPARISTLRKVGVPYPEGYEQKALADLHAQAGQIVTNLQMDTIKAQPDKEIIALIAYLQRLGTDIKAGAPGTAPAPVSPSMSDSTGAPEFRTASQRKPSSHNL